MRRPAKKWASEADVDAIARANALADFLVEHHDEVVELFREIVFSDTLTDIRDLPEAEEVPS